MNLVVLTEDFYPQTSGGAHTKWRFCQLAAERGHDVTVFTARERGLAKSEVVDNVEIHRPYRVKPENKPVHSPVSVITRICASIFLFAHVFWWFRDHSVDGIHSSSHLTHWIAKALSVQYDLPLVSFIGYTPSVDSDPSFGPQLLLERINFRFFMGQTVFCQTPGVKEIIERYTNGIVEVLHGIINRNRISDAVLTTNRNQRRTDLNVEENNILLTYVGRLTPLKNPVGAIEVLSELPPEYTLAVVGDGDERETIEQAVREHGVEDRVRICGALPHTDALATISAADALILTSHTESYPTVIFEALALNTEAFATPVGIIPNIDHPRLNVGSLNEFPQLISETTVKPSEGIDTETLERFSMERYADGLLSAFERQYEGIQQSTEEMTNT